ncbi:HNH endonuclease [Rodentibacter pneumotropicus]|uniref:HNH endonuclease n=1 Tax=Rodentibacter pneumotropicus TaxID=758 RepID=A0AAW5LCR6_9PAST|nr:NUMOD4 domain-containing protein [Rodentibacter pneumotropicus]MCQ9121597.1 HNH endonuclease [Rodentibacter pneumotropicus]
MAKINLRKEAKGREFDEALERWRPIKEFIGLYEISNFGRVRSISRYVRIGKGERLVEGKILKHNLKSGYPSVCLCNGEVEVYRHIHRLLALAFIPGFGDVVRHLDGNPLNYSLDNLAWGSYSDNEADKKLHGRTARGETHGVSKLNNNLVRQIREMHKNGFSQVEIAKAIGIGRVSVGNVIHGKTWGHVV